MTNNWRICNFFVLLAILAILVGCSSDDDDDWIYLTPDQPRSWGSAELLAEVDAGYNVGFPRAAASGSGTIAVWAQAEDSAWSIMAKTSDGADWKPAQKIDSGKSFVRNQQVAMTDEGKAIVVWQQYGEDLYSIWANTFDGSVWGTPKQLDDDTSNTEPPQIAVSAGGTAVVVWEQKDTAEYSNKRIWANTFDGEDWGEAESIHEDEGDNLNAHVAMTADGKAVAVWNRETGSDPVLHQIWANTFDGANWGDPEQISNADDSSVGGSHVAMTADGKAIAVWQQRDGTRYCIWGNTFDGTDWDTGAWETPDQIATDPAGHCVSAQVAMSADGSAVAVWQLNETGSSGQHVRAKFFNGETWDEEAAELDDSSENAHFEEVAMSAGGSAVAVWYQNDCPAYHVWSSSFDGARWSTSEKLSTGTEACYSPRVAMKADGKAVAVWQQGGDSTYSIWTSFFH